MLKASDMADRKIGAETAQLQRSRNKILIAEKAYNGVDDREQEYPAKPLLSAHRLLRHNSETIAPEITETAPDEADLLALELLPISGMFWQVAAGGAEEAANVQDVYRETRVGRDCSEVFFPKIEEPNEEPIFLDALHGAVIDKASETNDGASEVVNRKFKQELLQVRALLVAEQAKNRALEEGIAAERQAKDEALQAKNQIELQWAAEISRAKVQLQIKSEERALAKIMFSINR